MLAGMQDAKENPYRHATLEELWSACQRAAVKLEGGTVRSAEERRELAADVRHLLLAIALCLNTGEFTPGAPENALAMNAKRELPEVFGAFAEAQARQASREARRLAAIRAADFVLGNKAMAWLHPSGGWVRADPGVVATDSPEGLAGVLARLGDIYRTRGRARSGR